MSNIETAVDHHTIDETQAKEFGEALARRLAATSPNPGAASVINVPPGELSTEESLPPSTESTDSTELPSEDGGLPPVVTDTDAGDASASEDAASTVASPESPDAGTVDGDTDSTPVSPATFQVGDATYTSEQITRMQKLTDWATGLDPRVAQAMAAIEQGAAAAIDAQEYQQFLAWRSTRGNQQQQQQQQATNDLLDGLDDEQRAYVAQLQQQATAAQQQSNGASASQIAFEQQRLQTELDTRAVTFADTCDAWGRSHNLTEQQVAELAQVAVDNDMFRVLANAERVLHPVNGSVIHEADMASVTEKALNFALVNDPALYTQVATGTQTAATRAAVDAQADSAVSLKKARGASLAAAPSQATVTPPVDVTKLRPDELRAGMSAFIAQQEGIPQHE